MTDWECVNTYGATVFDGLYENEARLIALQHGLEALEDLRRKEIRRRVRYLQHAKFTLPPDEWYAVEVERMAERAPA